MASTLHDSPLSFPQRPCHQRRWTEPQPAHSQLIHSLHSSFTASASSLSSPHRVHPLWYEPPLTEYTLWRWRHHHHLAVHSLQRQQRHAPPGPCLRLPPRPRDSRTTRDARASPPAHAPAPSSEIGSHRRVLTESSRRLDLLGDRTSESGPHRRSHLAAQYRPSSSMAVATPVTNSPAFGSNISVW